MNVRLYRGTNAIEIDRRPLGEWTRNGKHGFRATAEFPVDVVDDEFWAALHDGNGELLEKRHLGRLTTVTENSSIEVSFTLGG